MILQFGNSNYAPEKGPVSAMRVPVLPLGNRRDETILADATEIESRSDSLRLWQSELLIGGLVSIPVSHSEYKQQTHVLYASIFEAIGEANVYRCWNYSPFINEGEGDDECYRRFCEGRAMAFADRFGTESVSQIPSGSCVGAEGDHLVVAFVAGSAPARHFENPRQVPAYRYPREYGPRSPSFARATFFEANGVRCGFISGTSAVLGHASVGIGNLDAQMSATQENLGVILDTCSVDLNASNLREAKGKVYLRRAEDYPRAKAFMDQGFPDFAEKLVYLRSDICRRELLFEVELSVVTSL